jgi:hypothetical protein
MDQMTQQNAAVVEEAAASAESLEDQASKLVEGVSVFKLADGTAAPQPERQTGSNNQRFAQVKKKRTLQMASVSGNGHAKATAGDESNDWETF